MATIARGKPDAMVERIRNVLDDHERLHAGSSASVYRQNSAAIRIRIVDERFAGWPKGQRHDYAWKFIADRLSEDDIQEISMLLLVTPAERPKSFLNAEFDDPVSSNL